MHPAFNRYISICYSVLLDIYCIFKALASLSDPSQWVSLRALSHTENTGNGMSFKGNHNGKDSYRSKRTFTGAHTITYSIEKDAKCSDQYVVLSPRASNKWSWTPISGQLGFAWNCDKIYIYGQSRDTVEYSTCNMRKRYDGITITVKDGTATFSVPGCDTISTSSGSMENTPYYVHIGADADSSSKKRMAKFYDLEVSKGTRSEYGSES